MSIASITAERDALRKENRALADALEALAGALEFILDLSNQDDVMDVAYQALKEAGLR